MKLSLKLLFILTVISFIFPSKSYADLFCQPTYGGGQSCTTANSIEVNEKVLSPDVDRFADNLTINDAKYHPGSIVTFQISIANATNKNALRIDVKDVLPQYITFVSGPGTFDANSKTLSFSISLLSNETKTFIITGRVPNMDQILIKQDSVVCVVNQASATSDNINFSQDNSQFCINKNQTQEASLNQQASPIENLPVISSSPLASPSSSLIKNSPATGPADFQLVGLAITGMAGYFLRKRAQSLL